mgnify:CR=1 FL=1
MTAVLPLNRTGQAFYVPAFELKLNGRTASRGLVRDLTEVTYEDSLDAIDSFLLSFNNTDTDHLRPQFIGQGADEANWTQVQPQNGVELRMGYQGDLRLMLTGYITALEVDFPESGFSKLTVRGLNVLDRFRDRQYTWSWPASGNDRVKDSDVAEDLGQAPNSPEGHPGLAGRHVPVGAPFDPRKLGPHGQGDHLVGAQVAHRDRTHAGLQRGGHLRTFRPARRLIATSSRRSGRAL